jgi:hypothetical protein
MGFRRVGIIDITENNLMFNNILSIIGKLKIILSEGL